MRKQFTFEELENHEFFNYDLSAQWLETMGPVEHGFHCLIWGLPGSGKTTFTISLCGELTKFGSVYYNSLEQGFSGSLKNNLKAAKLTAEQKKKIKGRCHNFDEMCKALETMKVKFIVIDSAQYLSAGGLTYTQYKKLKSICARGKKSLIIISHARGELPKGFHLQSISYDVDVKIHVVKGVATARSRYGVTSPYIIYNKKNVVKPEGLFLNQN